MHTARIFTNGNSQAVRLPKQFRVDKQDAGSSLSLSYSFHNFPRITNRKPPFCEPLGDKMPGNPRQY